LVALTAVPDLLTVAFQEFEIDSAVSANANPVDHADIGAVPVLVTVNWSWYPPGSHEFVIEEVSVHLPVPVVVGEGDGDGDVDGDVDGEGEGEGEGPVDVV